MSADRMTCPYCRAPVPQVTGREVYPHRPDLYGKQFYKCTPCDATVGCHPDGRPLGRLANAELRREKQATHALFDPLWQGAREIYDGWNSRIKNTARVRAYEWLADKMAIEPDDCHIGMFTVSACREARSIIETNRPTPASIRAWAKSRRTA